MARNAVVAAMAFGITQDEARRRFDEGICISCGKVPSGFDDEASAREFGVAGTCQACQDLVYGSLPDEDD